MQEINLKLTIDEVNAILEGVGALPFAKVYMLVGKIQEQAAEQIKAGDAVKAEPAFAAGRTAEAGR